MNISVEQKNTLIDASIRFLDVLNQIYGSERAMEFWGSLSDVVDKDLKGQVFAAMLTGGCGGDVVIKKLPQNPNAIGIIKAIRSWDKRSLGLKEAKDMYDALRQLGQPIRVEVFYERAAAARREFSELGCI